MQAYSPEIIFFVTGLLLALTALAGSLSSRFGIPAVLGFLVLGMLAGSDGPGGIAFNDYLVAQGVGIACLVFILFSGGLDTEWRRVRIVAMPAVVLATAGVIVSAAIMAAASILLLGFTPLQGLLLGSIIASTDAAAVFAVLRSMEVPLDERVRSLIELESGSNDPMAIFLVGAALLLITTPEASPLLLAPSFGTQMAVGAAVGAAVGLGLSELLRHIPLRVRGFALVISIAAALMGYGLAEVLQGNGFLAAYLAGIVAASREHPAQRTIAMFQDGIAWLAQVTMFLTLGLLVFPSELPGVILPGLALTFVLMLVARPASVFLCLWPFRSLDWRDKLFISWAGLRGAVPIVLATFAIVARVPSAQIIFNIVFFVVLVSSAVQGPTLGWVARRTGVVSATEEESAASSVRR